MLNCYLWSRQLSPLEFTIVERCRAIYRDEPSEIKSGQGFFTCMKRQLWCVEAVLIHSSRPTRIPPLHLRSTKVQLRVLGSDECFYKCTGENYRTSGWMTGTQLIYGAWNFFFQINAIIFSLCISFSVQCPRHWKKSPAGVFQRKKQIQVSWSVSNWEGRIRQHFDLSVHVHLL